MSSSKRTTVAKSRKRKDDNEQQEVSKTQLNNAAAESTISPSDGLPARVVLQKKHKKSNEVTPGGDMAPVNAEVVAASSTATKSTKAVKASTVLESLSKSTSSSKKAVTRNIHDSITPSKDAEQSDSNDESDSVVSGDSSSDSGDDEKVQFADQAGGTKRKRKRSTTGPKERNKTSRKNRVFSAEDDTTITLAVQAAIARKIHVNWSALGESMGRMGCICRRRWFRHLSLQYGDELKLPRHAKPGRLSVPTAGHIFGSNADALAASMSGATGLNDSSSDNTDAARKPRQTFGDHDDEHILQAIRDAQVEGSMVNWELIGAALNRTGQACKQRWKLTLAPRNPELVTALNDLSGTSSVMNVNYTPVRKPRQAFTDPDDAYIVHAVRTAHTNGENVLWDEVGQALHRTGQACKQRWLLTLAQRHPEVHLLFSEEFSQDSESVLPLNYNPTRKVRRTFTDIDDAHILHAVRSAQTDGGTIVWKEVGVPLDRTGEACKQRWRLTLAPRHPELTFKD